MENSRPTDRRRWLRGLLFRSAALLLGLLPFVLIEALLAILGLGEPACHDDPFVGFSAVYPLFVPTDDGTRYEIPPSRRKFFRRDEFPAHKGSKDFRIFCLGGSTVQGRPFSIETSFTTWLEFDLRAADTSRNWDVINCGGISYASYRLVPILEEVLRYQPDLIILYTGHNEFLEDRTYRQIKYLPAVVARPWGLLSRTRTYTLLRAGYVELGGRGALPGRPILGPETDAMLEYRGGLQQYHRDEKWRRDVIEHYRYNLRRMVQMARQAGVEILLLNPVCNLRDCPPFKSQHREALTSEELRQWTALVSQAEKHEGTDMPQAVALLQKALAIDDQYAGLHYRLAKCYDAMGKTEQAYRSYLRAKELDICPLRILEPMNEAVLETARQTDTPLIDVRKMFEKLSEDGIPGNYYLVDHVHPSIAGHRLIADALTEELIREGIVRAIPNWKEGMNQLCQAYLYTLGRLYFEKGRATLENLRGWTQGKARRVRPQANSPQAEP